MDAIEKNWEAIKSSIKMAVDLIKEFHINSSKLLPSLNALIPIIYYAYIKKLKIFEEKDKERIKKWLINSLLSGAFGGQSDTVLYLSKEAIDNSDGEGFPDSKIVEKIIIGTKGRKIPRVDKTILDKIKYGDDESYLLLFLIYPTDKINFNVLDKKGRPQQDHIFSYKELSDAGFTKEKIDDIGNIRFVSTYDNQSKQDKLFKEWIKNISDEERKLHLLPTENYWNNYEEFIGERKRLMLEKLKI
jgi:hypothetical protein